MGVPGFFAWLLKNYKSEQIILTECGKIIDILYIDANCLFHPQCFKILNHYISIKQNISKNKLEDQMFQRCVDFIDFLIKYVSPTTHVYIAVDGPAPMAKVNQQRKRRYKSNIESKLINEIKQRYSKSTSTIWSNTSITPGTEFMEKLHNHILNYITTTKPIMNINFTYSSYHTIGEGEHKILQHIKSLKGLENICIYGLDADLIFLSLASNRPNIFLLREELNNNKPKQDKLDKTDKTNKTNVLPDISEDLCYVSIDETRKCINYQFEQFNQVNQRNKTINTETTIDLTNDFIVLCFLLGNDFIPNIPSVDIKTRSLEFILSIYMKISNEINSTLIIITDNCPKLNMIFFTKLVNLIGLNEEYYFSKIYLPHLDRLNNYKCKSDDAYDLEIFLLENLYQIRGNNDLDDVKLGKIDHSVAKFNYYNHYCHEKANQSHLINNICENYLKGIKWTIDYYFSKCSSYDYQYIYPMAPFCSDLYNYLNKQNTIDLNSIKFESNIILTPFMQLLSVIPPSCSDLLPKSYSNIMHNFNQLSYLFPLEVKMDYLCKDTLHKCMPLVCNVDLHKVLNAVKNLPLSNSEKKRNEIYNDIII